MDGFFFFLFSKDEKSEKTFCFSSVDQKEEAENHGHHSASILEKSFSSSASLSCSQTKEIKYNNNNKLTNEREL